MATFVLVHGSTHSPRAWDLVKAQLEQRQHAVVTPELPADEPEAGAARYTEVIAAAIPDNDEPVVVAHSAAGWFLPLLAARRRVRRMVFLAAAVPVVGMSFLEQLQAIPEMMNPAWLGKDPRNEDVADEFLLHDCPPDRLSWAHATIRIVNLRHAMSERYPLNLWPEVAASYIVCSEDRTFRPAWSRRIARTQLGVEALEIAAGHCPYISRAERLAEILANDLS